MKLTPFEVTEHTSIPLSIKYAEIIAQCINKLRIEVTGKNNILVKHGQEVYVFGLFRNGKVY